MQGNSLNQPRLSHSHGNSGKRASQSQAAMVPADIMTNLHLTATDSARGGGGNGSPNGIPQVSPHSHSHSNRPSRLNMHREHSHSNNRPSLNNHHSQSHSHSHSRSHSNRRPNGHTAGHSTAQSVHNGHSNQHNHHNREHSHSRSRSRSHSRSMSRSRSHRSSHTGTGLGGNNGAFGNFPIKNAQTMDNMGHGHGQGHHSNGQRRHSQSRSRSQSRSKHSHTHTPRTHTPHSQSQRNMQVPNMNLNRVPSHSMQHSAPNLGAFDVNVHSGNKGNGRHQAAPSQSQSQMQQQLEKNAEFHARRSGNLSSSRNWFIFGLLCCVSCVICFMLLSEHQGDRYSSDDNGGGYIAFGLFSLLCTIVGFVQAWQARRAATDPNEAEMP